MKYVFGNWKMYLNVAESCALADALASESYDADKVTVAVFPNFLAITDVQEKLSDSSISVGGQTCAWTPQGAYTGAVSAHLLKEIGCEYVLVGHSERRHVFGESDVDVRKRLEAALDVGLTPVLCIGETREDRDNDKTQYRLKKQLMSALENLDLSGRKLIVAYEPVWAISKAGVGTPCSASDADDVHGWIIEELKQYTDMDIPLLYGGSATADNVIDYLSRDTIDGVLVGGASRKADTFVPMIHKAQELA